MRRLKGMIAIGLAFCVLAFVAQGEGAGGKLAEQVVEGFAERVSSANGPMMYDTCREEQRESWWLYDDGNQAVEWRTARVPEAYTSGRITFVWSCGMTGREAIDVPHHLYLNGKRVITFTAPVQDTVHQRDRLWREGEYTLFYDYARTNGWGDSFGVMHLAAPASAISPGRPATLKVVGSPSGAGSFFMLTDYTDTVEWLRTNYDGGPVPGVGEVTEEGIAALIEDLKGDQEGVRLSAASDLIRLGERAGVPVLADLLLKGSLETRRAAAADLGRIRDRSTVAALTDALDDEDADVRLAALNSLGNIRDTSATSTFTRILQTGDREMRLAALTVLAKVSDRSTVPPLVQALGDDDREVRMLSARALAEIPDRTALPALTAALRDEYVWVRDAAAYALGEIGDRSAVPALIETLGDSDEFVRKAAGAALCTVTGRTWPGTDPEEWQAWWERTGKIEE